MKFRSDVSTNSFGFRAYYYCNEVITDVTLSPSATLRTGFVEGLKIYPNSASDVLTIECSEEIKEVRISDIIGKLIASPLPDSYRDSLQKGRGTVDVSQFSSGIYNLCVFTNEKMLTRKIIIARD